MSGDREYAVGYGKPPKHTQFQKGQSGNPKGRPKGAKNLKTELEEEFQERIVVREGNTRKTVSKQRAMIKGLLAKAVQGDARAATLLTNLALRLSDRDGPEPLAAVLDEEDRAILEAHGIPLRQEAKEAETSKTEESEAGPEESFSESPPSIGGDTEAGGEAS